MLSEQALPQLKVRLPQQVKDQVTDRAKKNERSANSEIVYLLKVALRVVGGEHAA